MKKSKVLLLSTALIFFIFQFTKTEGAVERIILGQNAIKEISLTWARLPDKQEEGPSF